jgi:hypothetical protein
MKAAVRAATGIPAKTLRAGELAGKVFINAPGHVHGLGRRFVEANIADAVRKTPEGDSPPQVEHWRPILT